jgi:hypothetical protein
MNSQLLIIKQYLLTYQNPTIKQISIQTGIQQTRVFRLLNGSEMKISEYEIFLNLIKKKIGSNNHLNSLLEACCLKLNSKSIQEIENLMLRKLAIWDLKQNNKSTHSQNLTA